jgi:hypothetical protein
VNTFITENLKIQGTNKRAHEEQEDDDDDENFSKAEKTQKNDNLDFFAKLMKSRVDDSCKQIITFFS